MSGTDEGVAAVDETVAGDASVAGADVVEEPEDPRASADWRPWHGALNPFEALYEHFTAEIAKVRGGS